MRTENNTTSLPISETTAEKDVKLFLLALKRLIQKENPFGLLVIGIDNFKHINDLESYSFGDFVLDIYGEKMRATLPVGVSLYRLDGDNFGILYPNALTEDLIKLYKDIQQLSKQPFEDIEPLVAFTISAGICLFSHSGEDEDAIYRNARIALRNAKNNGKNQYSVYSERMLEQEKFYMLLSEDLKKNLENGYNGFFLDFQPIMRAKTGELYGCEALLRYTPLNPNLQCSPEEFIPVLEENCLMNDVGKWLLKTALKQLSVWIQKMPDFQMSINITCKQFDDSYFKFYVMETLSEFGIDPGLVTLELTESQKIADTAYIRQALDFLRSQGIKIALDDFGTGYASLEIFRSLSVDELKIDKSFLQRLSYDIDDQKLIGQIISLSHSMNIAVCVEGIEDQKTEELVLQFEPELLQGFYYSKPLNSQKFESCYLDSNFTKKSIDHTVQPANISPERLQSMVYSPLRPAKSMTLEEIINNVHAGIFQVGMDHEFTFLACNDGYRKMLGYTAKEIEEKFKNHALGFVHPEDIDFVNEEIRRQLGYGDTVTIEFRIVRSDGIPLWIIGTGNVVKGTQGDSSLIVVILDNNANKLKELEQHQKLLTYEKILNNLPTGIKMVRFDENFTLDYISPGLLSILGYQTYEIKSIFDGKYINMIYEDDRRKVISDVVEQLKKSKVVTMRYRSYCKNGSLIWLETVAKLCEADEDGIQRACSCVINITESISDIEKNREISFANRYQAAANQWGDVLFEYNFKDNTLYFSDNFKTVFGRDAAKTLEEELQYIHKDDQILVTEMLAHAKENHTIFPIEVRAKLVSEERYAWFSIIVTPPDMLGSAPVSVLGRLNNIDNEKRERESLLEISQSDSLTKLLNKGAIEKAIRKELLHRNTGDQYALFILDVDSFKSVNDIYGHIVGDHSLQVISKRVKMHFHENDMVGRAGGDEFMVFMKYSGSLETIQEEARKLIEVLHQDIELGSLAIKISVSIGISRCPENGVDFYDLYRKADSALYSAKERGKNQYCFATK